MNERDINTSKNTNKSVKVDLNDINLNELKANSKNIEDNTDRSPGRVKKYKGVTNYLEEAKELESKGVSTVNIEAELVERSKYTGRESNAKNLPHQNKRVGSLPYKDMLAYYVKGEKVIKGGIKHTTSPTYEDIAKKFNCSYHAITAYAAKHNWVEKRRVYREKMTDDFSFLGQMAADTNGEVLSASQMLMKKVAKRIGSPTFMPDPEKIVEKDGRYFVIDESADGLDDLIPLLPEGKQLHGSQVLLNIAKSLDTINRICNSTVQVEVDNVSLIEDTKSENPSKRSESRMRQIEQLQQRLREAKK